MTDTAIIGAFVFMALLLVVVAICGMAVSWLQERAYQRAQEAKYAEEYIAARRHRHDNRHTHEQEGRPE